MIVSESARACNCTGSTVVCVFQRIIHRTACCRCSCASSAHGRQQASDGDEGLEGRSDSALMLMLSSLLQSLDDVWTSFEGLPLAPTLFLTTERTPCVPWRVRRTFFPTELPMSSRSAAPALSRCSSTSTLHASTSSRHAWASWCVSPMSAPKGTWPLSWRSSTRKRPSQSSAYLRWLATSPKGSSVPCTTIAGVGIGKRSLRP
mmetsp:Transcript_13949/g.36025  ORF Transcript_13949/g.36025 Transcript_13949/m.36025 type:complete len:204 (-) Transcript_13949:252-863(-)